MSEIVAVRRLEAADSSAGVLGMTYEGRPRHRMLIHDGWRDSEIFSILEDEWRAR